MFNSYLTLVPFLILLTIIHSGPQYYYTPELLAKEFKHITTTDPNLLINYDYVEKIKNFAQNITDKNLSAYLFIIRSMSHEWQIKNVDYFVNDLTYLIFEGNTDLEQSSIVVFVSENDRKVKIRTGRLAREKLSDSDSENIISDALSLFKNQNYNEGCLLIFKKIKEYVNGETGGSTAFWWIFGVIIGTIVLISLFATIDAVIKCQRKKQQINLSNEERDKLNRLKALYETNTHPNEFLSTTCSICLNNLENTVIPAVSLHCGHCYHSSCIDRWLDTNRTCPICRSNISYEILNNPRDFYLNLLNVQKSYHPNLSRINYNYSTNYFIWDIPDYHDYSHSNSNHYHRHESTSAGNIIGSTFNVDWGSGSGGAQGSW